MIMESSRQQGRRSQRSSMRWGMDGLGCTAGGVCLVKRAIIVIAILLAIIPLKGCSRDPAPAANDSHNKAPTGQTLEIFPTPPNHGDTAKFVPWNPKQGKIQWTKPTCEQQFPASGPVYLLCKQSQPCAKIPPDTPAYFECQSEETRKNMEPPLGSEAYKIDPTPHWDTTT
jgi:hypothetical protein